MRYGIQYSTSHISKMHVDILSVNLLSAAANYNYASYIDSLQPQKSVQVTSYDPRFTTLMGNNITATITDQQDWEFAYAAPPLLPLTKAHPLPQPRSRNLPPLHTLHLRHLPNHLPHQPNKYQHSLQHNLHPTLLLHQPLPPHPQRGYSLQHNPPPLLHLRRPHHSQHSHPLRPGRQLRLPHPLLLLRQKLLLP